MVIVMVPSKADGDCDGTISVPIVILILDGAIDIGIVMVPEPKYRDGDGSQARLSRW